MFRNRFHSMKKYSELDVPIPQKFACIRKRWNVAPSGKGTKERETVRAWEKEVYVATA